MKSYRKPKNHEALLWSIALPGFGQFLNGSSFKGCVFVLLEFLVNVLGKFNLAIIYSFQGEIQKAIDVTNFQWLMFYPCLYMFAIWDAYRNADGEVDCFSYLPFVFGAFSITIGLIYSTSLKIFGVIIGPVFLPMLSLVPGLLIGFIVYKLVIIFKN